LLMKERLPFEVPSPALHRFALVAASATFCLIFVGGLVTSTGSALAVPDWPLAFGKLIPAWKGGIRFEFGHRVVAGVVVILTIALMGWTLRSQERRWVRNLTLVAVGLVFFQAVLGGMTVLFDLPLAMAVAHAATAQAFFCLMVSIAMFMNPSWLETVPRREAEAHPPLGTLAAITTGVIYLQILVGAVMRHLGAGLAIPDFPLAFGKVIPPHFNKFIAVNFAHRCGAIIVAVMVGWTVARVIRAHREVPQLYRTAIGLAILLVVQICLGALTIWSGRAVIPTTSHVAVGAATLATSLALTIRAYHIYGLPGRALAGAPEASVAAQHGVRA
jgi:cytochrome c oxidase assembly protein subunit 15